MSDPKPRPIRAPDELDDVLDESVAVVYKHSPFCGASASAARHVRRFMDEHPSVPVYLVDVIRDRALAREVARRLAVRHESPQALLLRDGEVEWSGSHTSVTASALRRGLEGSNDDGGDA